MPDPHRETDGETNGWWPPTWYRAGVEGQRASAARLLKEKLPEYMVSSASMPLDALPLTPNCKVDRDALLAPDARPGGEETYVAPWDETELKLATICAELLALEAPPIPTGSNPPDRRTEVVDF